MHGRGGLLSSFGFRRLLQTLFQFERELLVALSANRLHVVFHELIPEIFKQDLNELLGR